eukprot:3929146-Rhodomonas_salina.1
MNTCSPGSAPPHTQPSTDIAPPHSTVNIHSTVNSVNRPPLRRLNRQQQTFNRELLCAVPGAGPSLERVCGQVRRGWMRRRKAQRVGWWKERRRQEQPE